MNCNLTSKTPRITRGNDFKLLVPLREYAVDSSGGKTEQDLELGAITEVNVIKSDGSTLDGTGIFTYERVGSTSSVLITFGGGTGAPALANGKYGIEIIGTRSDGSDFRFYKTPGNGFVIVESTDEGYVPADTIMTYTVSGVVGVAIEVSGGGSASVGTLNTTNTTSQATNASESFGGNINLHKVSKTGSYNDLNDKPTIPSLSGYATQQWVNSALEGFLATEEYEYDNEVRDAAITNLQTSVGGKEDKLAITTPTITNNALTLSVSDFGKFFKLGTLTATTVITLPNMANENVTNIIGCIFDVTIGMGGALDINATQDIYENGLSSIEEGKRYEINVIYATEWRITAVELTEYSTT